jgi:hypothetical protein
MTAPQRTTLVCAALWVPLTCWQFAGAAAACGYDGPSAALSWGLLGLAMIAPLVPIVQWSRAAPAHAPLVLLLASYVPLTLALALVQRCAG